ncbi:hypothetical protein C8R48DRAFT_774815 [Suillus tomentosus]|nr:hypothetical protein C8R48DRAFT_774815 [Suillus tomentosus]
MSDQIDGLDLFDLLPLLPADSEETIALRAEVDKLSTRLTHIIQSAPSQHDGNHILEKEEWCKNLSDLKDQLAKHLTLACDNKVVVDLPVFTRQDWQKGYLLCVVFQSQVSTFKDAAAKQAELVLRQTAATSTSTSTTTAPAPATTPTTTPTPTTMTSTECAPVSGEREGADQEQETQQEVEEESEEINEWEDSEETQAPPDKKSGQVGRRKCTPRMSAKKLLNPVPCTTCMTMQHPCHNWSKGQLCYECHHGKVKCSLVQNKGKKKTAVPPPSPVLAPKPKNRPKPVAPTSHPVQTSSKATQVPGLAARTQSKYSEPPAVALAQPWVVPGPLCIQNNAYVELRMSTKQKVAIVKEEESESESEDGEEDAYLADRVSGLSNIPQMIEMACATMRKEVEKIDGRFTKRRH